MMVQCGLWCTAGMISDTHPRGSDALAGSLPSPRHGSAASAEQHSSEPQSSATQAAVALATEAPATAVTRPPPERSDPSPPPSPPRSQASPSTPPTDSSDLEAAREYYAAFRRRLAEAYEQQPQQPADVLLDDPATVSLMQSIAEHVPERDSKTLPSLDELVQIRFKADRHLQSSELYKAEPFLCRLAWNALIRLGPDHPVTLDTVHEIVINQVLRARTEYSVQSWLLPRFAAHFGVDHPDAQQLVTYAAIGLYRIKDPRTEPDLMTAATDVAVRLPHGLGWGPRATPLPDEDAFNRHAVMMAKAQDIMSQGEGHYKLAKDMLTRCVAYYEQLGLHWLGTPRKVRCMMLIGDCISEMDGDAAAQQYLFTAKRTAQNELGYEHILTTQISWEVRHLRNTCILMHCR